MASLLVSEAKHRALHMGVLSTPTCAWLQWESGLQHLPGKESTRD